MTKVPVSLEFFPPKTPEGMTKLAAARAELYALKPEFCSVTYGAGGSTQMGTLQVVEEIRAEGFLGVPHYTCIGATRASVGGLMASPTTPAAGPRAGCARRLASRNQLRIMCVMSTQGRKRPSTAAPRSRLPPHHPRRDTFRDALPAPSPGRCACPMPSIQATSPSHT